MVKSRPLTVRKFCMNWDWSMPNELRIGPTPVLPMSREFCRARHTGEYTRVPRTNERRVGRTTRVSVRLVISSLASPCQAAEKREAGGPPLYPSPPVPRLRGLRGAADAAGDASLQELTWESSCRSQCSSATAASFRIENCGSEGRSRWSFPAAAWPGELGRDVGAMAEGSPKAAPCVLAGAPSRCPGEAFLLQVAGRGARGADADGHFAAACFMR
mmetsp:Transcript_57451/g.179982  ORF Transcript_57451/g.179982 Transcript_57451/m.179982 type:complete len:216 (-) Transcript_57451:237-884(-)